MTYVEHHYRNLARARDHLTEAIVSLSSAADRMMGDEWIDATVLLAELTHDVGPRLAQLRDAASQRFDEHSRLENFDQMRAGEIPFPDERAPEQRLFASTRGLQLLADPVTPPRRLNAPNVKEGAKLVAFHGGVDAAMKAYEPDSAEFDHIQAFRYVAHGRRPPRWIPTIVTPDEAC